MSTRAMSTKRGRGAVAASSGGDGGGGPPPAKKPTPPDAGGLAPKLKIRLAAGVVIDAFMVKIEQMFPFQATRLKVNTHIGDYAFDNSVVSLRFSLHRPVPFTKEIFAKTYVLYSELVLEELKRDMQMQLHKYQRWIDYAL